MGIEIERKYLVVSDAWREFANPTYFSQGYLNSEKERTVRVRIAGKRALLTIKGLSLGATRPEFEYDIPLEDARQLLSMCEQPLIEKNRTRICIDDAVWEIDEFLGDNAGLIIAEIELQSEDQAFEKTPVGRRRSDRRPSLFQFQPGQAAVLEVVTSLR